MYRKGYDFERALRLKLESDGWRVVRSGGSRKPDLVAGKDGKVLIIECKVVSGDRVYIEKGEVENISEVAHAFGGEAVFAIKRKRKGIVIASVEKFRLAGKHYVLKLE